MWALCDLAHSLIMSKNFELTDVAMEPVLSPSHFKPHPDPSFTNDQIYIPTELATATKTKTVYVASSGFKKRVRTAHDDVRCSLSRFCSFQQAHKNGDPADGVKNGGKSHEEEEDEEEEEEEDEGATAAKRIKHENVEVIKCVPTFVRVLCFIPFCFFRNRQLVDLEERREGLKPHVFVLIKKLEVQLMYLKNA